MKYRSLTTPSHTYSFEEALFQGLAHDGSLIVPTHIPRLSQATVHGLNSKSLPEIGATILTPFIDDIPYGALVRIIKQAITWSIPLVPIGDFHIAELFHGPTLAFKDIATHILAGLMDVYATKHNRTCTILTATSGDTGAAVAQAFVSTMQSRVFILFPKNGVSQLQYEQLTRGANHIYPLEVDGSFDDCQHMVKQAFIDSVLAPLHLTTANSINIARLIPQMLFYAYIYSQLNKPFTPVIPSGNMGNAAAALYAQYMGIPIQRIIIACNANDTVPNYLKTGIYQPQTSIKTLSNAMDIGNPSNLARMLDIYDQQHHAISQQITAHSITDKETVKTIKQVYQTHQYLLDPHSAVAWTAATKEQHVSTPVVMATASPIKFAHELTQATGIAVDNQSELDRWQSLPQRIVSLPNSYHALQKYLLENKHSNSYNYQIRLKRICL